MITDIYHYPNLNVSPATQASDVVKSLSGYGTVWLDVEGSWTSDKNANCNFLTSLVNAYKSAGKIVGIYSNRNNWINIFGGSGNCAKFTSLPIWYAHYDGVASFADWPSSTFGGWTKPAMK